uniref:Oxidation resistance protein 1 n=1 Tax=Alexandrium catenella TaxID=2925 RepID=A0A7S1PVA9_ALECA
MNSHQVVFPLAPRQECGLANGQDADEAVPQVPSWQMPQLVIECNQRSMARIHKGTSVILPDAGGDLIAGIVANLPVLLQIRPCWHLGYSMAVDGVSLQTMYRQVADMGPCLLIVEDSNNCIFGAFLSEGLMPGGRCYGTHDCFVFRYPRAAGPWRIAVYGRASQPQAPVRAAEALALGDDQRHAQQQGAHWASYQAALRKCQACVASGSPSSLVFCDHTGIVVGVDGPALFIDQNLLRGVSWSSGAFGCPCLAAAGPDFVVRNLEVWHWGQSAAA